MLKILLLTCFIETKQQINIHDQYGCVTEEKKQRFIERRTQQVVSLTIPLEIRVPNGPLQAETQE